MNCKLQSKRRKNIEGMKDKKIGLLLLYKIVGGECWQERALKA